MKAWRIGLVVLGVLLLVIGAAVMVDTVAPVKIAGLASWFVLAIILHDGIIAFVTFGAAFLMRKAGRRMPVAVIVIVQSGLVVGSVFAIIVLPAVYKKFLGTRNPTVLPLDYGVGVLILWVAVAAATALAVVAVYAFARRQKNRPPLSQA